MIEESKYCSDVIKKKFDKEISMTKEDNEEFRNSTKCLIFDGDVKVRDHCHITGKCRGFVHRDGNINVKSNHKIPAVFHNLIAQQNYDFHLKKQELGKFNLRLNVIPNELTNYMGFSINNKLTFTDSFKFLSSSYLS